jgi:excisionase family DNA binding protein
MRTQTSEDTAPDMAGNKLLTTESAAAFLGFSKGYLYKLVSANKIAYYRPGGKILYFTREDLERYILHNRIASKYELREKAETMLNGAR